MFYRFPRSAVAGVLSVCALFTSACTPQYINTDELGAPVGSEAEIFRLFSGNSFPNGSGGAFYGKDGSYRGLSPEGDSIVIGTWRTHRSLGTSRLCEEATTHYKNDGKTVSTGPHHRCYVVYLQPDGAVALDQMGGTNYDMGKPVRGFAMERRFKSARNRLKV